LRDFDASLRVNGEFPGAALPKLVCRTWLSRLMGGKPLAFRKLRLKILGYAQFSAQRQHMGALNGNAEPFAHQTAESDNPIDRTRVRPYPFVHLDNDARMSPLRALL